MNLRLIICTICCMVFCHAVFCQKQDNSNRFVLHAKKKHKRKLLFAQVAGMVNGAIPKDSLLKVNKVSMSDLQHKYKNIRVVSFQLVAKRNGGNGKWTTLGKADAYSLYDGNHFTDRMHEIIKQCGAGDRIEIFVTGIYYDGMNLNGSSVINVGYGGHVCLCMK